MDRKPLLESSDSDDYTAASQESIRPSPPRNQVQSGHFAITFKQLAKLVKHGSLQKVKDAMKERNIQLSDAVGKTILHVAALTNNVEVLAELLHHKRCWALLNRQDSVGNTPLIDALLSQSYKTLEFLCIQGADPKKTQFKSGETVLHLAALKSDTEGARMLVKHYRHPDFINYTDSCGDTALTEAIHVNSPVFDILLNASADITMKNAENGRTMLHVVVAYNRQQMLKKTLNHLDATIDFVEIKDVQGDTALMIAVKLQNAEIIDTLTSTFSNLNGINYVEKVSVLHLAIESNRADILHQLINNTASSSLDYLDLEQRTPIMYAAELDSDKCLRELIEYGADFHMKNPDTGETLLHIIAKKHSNSALPFLMSLPHITWFFIQKDYEGNTPYMTAIKCGNDTFLRESFKVKKVDLCEYSLEGETTPYFSVKQGYPNVLLTLLLSTKYYTFAKQKQAVLDLNDPAVLTKAEIRGDIHATDLYILLKKVVQHPLVPYFPPNLLIKTKISRSVFHACSLGGSLECLEFLYRFFSLFAPKYFMDDFDTPGVYGNTPLSLAAQCGLPSVACVRFFVTHGADLASTNNDGMNVIEAIYSYNPNSADLFLDLFDTCVTAKKEHYYSDKLSIIVNFSILCPKRKDQMGVVAALFKATTGNDRRKVLQHPVIVIFLRQKLRNVHSFLYLRFYIELISTIVISILIPLLYIVDGDPEKRYGFLLYIAMKLVFILMVGACMLHLLLKTPYLMIKDLWFTDTIAIIPPISTLSLLISGKSFYFAPELGATAILSSWLCVLAFTINLYSTLSSQIAVFLRLLYNISKQLIVLIVLIFAFSLSFFCIHNKDIRFSHFPTSFIYTFTVMLPGYLSDMPTFNKDYYKNAPMGIHFAIECFVLGLFLVTAITGFINMLIGLAVRGGKHLEVDGKVFQNHHTAHYMRAIEYWFNNKMYYWFITKHNFQWLKKQKQKTIIDLTLNIYDKENKSICDDELVRQFRSIVFKKRKFKRKKENPNDVYNDPFGHLPGCSVSNG